MKSLSYLLIFIFSTVTFSQNAKVTVEDYQRAAKFLRENTTALVYNVPSRVTWDKQDRLIYRNAIKEGHEYILIANNKRQLLFDHQKMADALEKTSGKKTIPKKLNLSAVELSEDADFLHFTFSGNRYTCDLRDYSIGKIKKVHSHKERNISKSPDGKKAAFIRDHNLWLLDLESGKEKQLTTDGVEEFGYATNDAGWTRRDSPVLLWSPQSDKIATFQHDSRGVGYMHMVTTKVGLPKLKSFKYPLPGDSVIFRMHRVVIHLNDNKVVRLNMPPDPHRSTIVDHVARGGKWLDVEWSLDGEELAFVSSSRDHKIAELRMANPYTGEVRDVMKEVTKTYFESGARMVNWHVLNESNEVIWFSERDNWGHLYLYDLKTGKLKQQITKGDWAVLQLLRIDREKRQLYFIGSNKEDGDPYYRYLYRIDMDGKNLINLTPEYANHVITLSKSGRYIYDSYSTPVTPPITVIRDMNGKIVLTLEEADISDLLATGWQAPIPFTTKARDNKTDLYGLMYKPTNFDENRSYPILNYLYPGPQSGSVGSRSFRASRSDKQAVAELGFIVVEVDAMGTPGRSKSFHDAYYGNMGDNGLPDQITTIKQLAKRHAWMNIDQVGIWGHSGGGFASTAGILRYPDFYKVAVSGAGNHDNRNYEDDWGEKWQGLLKTNKDGTTNYDNQANQLVAKNLKGKLLLGHGTMDTNVPHSNTMLVVNALIEANKDFDFILFPNRGHGFGREKYWIRLRWDYFVKHLLKTEPPKEFEFNKQPSTVVF